MQAATLLRAGVGLSVVGLAMMALELPMAGLAALAGFAGLVLSLVVLVAPKRLPPMVAWGAALFVGGRLLPVLSAEAAGSLLLAIVSTAGTALLFVGVFQALQQRVGAPAPGPAEVAGGDAEEAPREAKALAKDAAEPAAFTPVRRPSAIRPPQAPLLQPVDGERNAP